MLLSEHLAQGERAVLFDRDVLWLDRQAFEHRLLEGDQLPEKAQRVLRERISRREVFRAATLLIPGKPENRVYSHRSGVTEGKRGERGDVSAMCQSTCL